MRFFTYKEIFNNPKFVQGNVSQIWRVDALRYVYLNGKSLRRSEKDMVRTGIQDVFSGQATMFKSLGKQ